MKLVIDMNLSPEWVTVFQRHGWEAKHWSAIGGACDADHVIMEWAQNQGHIVFTHDLDFGAMLAVTQALGPSVIQVRTQDVSPTHLEPLVVSSILQFRIALEAGALIVIDEHRSRVRLLPLT